MNYNYSRKNSYSRAEYLFAGELGNVSERFICQGEQDERIHERESVGQIVREMECMPDIIEHIEIEAEIYQPEKKHICNLFSYRYALAEKIERDEYYCRHSAIDIGKNIGSAASYCGRDACEVICKKVEYLEIRLDCFWPCSARCGAALENEIDGEKRERNESRACNARKSKRYSVRQE